MEIDNSEPEAASKPDEEDTAHRTQPDSSKCKRVSSTSSYQDELMASEEETRVAEEALESLQWADDPDRSPPREDEYFQGPGLWENIFKALSRKRSQPPSMI